MASGTVVRRFDKGFGFIKPEEGGPDVFFHRNACKLTWNELRPGTRVEYEAQTGAKGLEATRLRIIGKNAVINPYNFVRAPGGAVPPERDARTLLMGRCPPPPHDRYVGLTGRIRCTLVTDTETFVADSHGVSVATANGKKHFTYRCFRDADGRPAIPASSLRGAIRGIFEAATGSCLLMMNHEARYTYYQERLRREAEAGDRWRDGVRPVGELVPEEARPCTRPDHLCPGCRVFGWVRRESGDEAPAYRSRVRVTAAAFLGGEDDLVKPAQPVTLAVLGAPKPSYGRFYLLHADGSPLEGVERAQTEYLPENRIRGRKLYWPHAEAPLSGEGEAHPPSDQNRSIREWVRAGAAAEFDLAFSNLAVEELGALLWTLELEGAHVHRLGYGKPLGLGSVSIEVRDVAATRLQRYTDPVGGGFATLSNAARAGAVRRFEALMSERYGSEFQDLPNIRDLLMLLEAVEPEAPIRYPRIPDATRGFEWYQENEKAGAGRRRALPLATSDDPTLPVAFP